MSIRDRYRFHSSRKSIKPYTKLIILVVLGIAVFHTFARYISAANVNSILSIAKWSIEINEEDIEDGTDRLSQPISLISTSSNNTEISAGDRCYFDITINPNSTEVSVEYTILVDLVSQDTNLPEGTTIVKYEKYVGNRTEPSASTDVNGTYAEITGNVKLDENQTSLDSGDVRKYRIYCDIPQNAEIDDNDLTIVPTIRVKQYIED